MDEDLLLSTAHQLGYDASMVVWNDGAEKAAGFDALIIRSTWDYHLFPNEFLTWVSMVAGQTVLLNPVEAISWNIHKAYLQTLRDAGVPVVPTHFGCQGSEIESSLEQWERIVIKPCISGGSFKTRVFGRGNASAASDFALSLEAHGGAMIQPFVESVNTIGERSLIWINGEVRHSIKKMPRYEGEEESVSGPHPISMEELDVCKQCLACAPWPLLYARIDVMYSRDGRPLVSEFELIEPSLFLKQNPSAIKVLMDGVRVYGQ